MKNFFKNSDIEIEDLGDGIKRKVIAFNENLMAVEIYFEEGAVGAMHKHPHEQISYIIEGEFEFTIGGQKQILKPGDSAIKEPNILHGAICLKKGKLLDIFTPCREDYLNCK
ncbi:MAG: cupin domain-containing protein [Tissierellia bacterium]|nr:cupin domain-containing protein [Tissierellia bacterium]